MMNQASKLDEWRRSQQAVESTSLSVLTAGTVKGIESFLEAVWLPKAAEKGKGTLLTYEQEGGPRTQRLGPNMVLETHFYELFHARQLHSFVTAIRQKEEGYSRFVHFAGPCLDAGALTRGRLTHKLLIVMEPSQQGVDDVMGFLRIVEAKRFQQSIALIVDTENKEVATEHLTLLQEVSRNRFHYFVESIGFTSIRLAAIKRNEEVFKHLDLRFLERPESVSYSSLVETSLFGG